MVGRAGEDELLQRHVIDRLDDERPSLDASDCTTQVTPVSSASISTAACPVSTQVLPDRRGVDDVEGFRGARRQVMSGTTIT
jgi:hypothetical protein